MIQACHEIRAFTHGLSEAEFETDAKTQHAVAFALLKLGEAAKRLSPEIVDGHPEIAWSGMKGLRDILAHRYFGLDVTILWNTAIGEIPPPTLQLERLVRTLGPGVDP